MKRLTDLTNVEAKKFFLKGSSYFNGDFPTYISFEPILDEVSSILNGKTYREFKSDNPENFSDVNYSFTANKDGKFAWRPLELMHPVIYVSLVNLLCEEENWELVKKNFRKFERGIVECCSSPVVSLGIQSDKATQIKSWWQKLEQRSLVYSLEFSHLLHTDVTDCYGSLYTHSIPWALHGLGKSKSKEGKKDYSLLGNGIDAHVRAGRYGQTNGISQGSVLMDFIAELVLGYVDRLINCELGKRTDIKILRYRDDYKIFANGDEQAESILKVISDKLRLVGMKLGVSKTISCRNVVEGSIKPDKIAGIELRDLGTTNAKTIQKQLLRLHSFGQRFPNSGALKRLVSDFHTNISQQDEPTEDLEVQVAIATDIAFVSPATFPVVAGILSHMISLVNKDEKLRLWTKVHHKMARVPYNGYLEIWLQRVIRQKNVGVRFESIEPVCQIVNGESLQLWNCDWISNQKLKKVIDVSNIVVENPDEIEEVIQPKEVELFKQNAWEY